MVMKRKREAAMIMDFKKLKININQAQPKTAESKTAEALFQKTIQFVSSELFRVLSSHCTINAGIEFGESFYIGSKIQNMSFKDPSWSKLKLVYDFFTELIDSPNVDAPLLSSCIKPSFIRNLMDLFQSEDDRERYALLSVLQILYNKSDTHDRKLIRNSVFNEFYSSAASANEKHNGISELLIFLVNIVNEEYEDVGVQHDFRVFVVRGLIPLYKSNWLALFYSDLNILVEKLVQKNSRLAATIIQGLLKHWPAAGSSREYFFLEGVESVLWEIAQPDDDNLQGIVTPLFRRIAACLSSPHYKVAEKGLSLFTAGGNIQPFIEQNSEVVLPIIFTDLEIKAKNHWHLQTQALAHEVGDYLLISEPELYKECLMLWGL